MANPYQGLTVIQQEEIPYRGVTSSNSERRLFAHAEDGEETNIDNVYHEVLSEEQYDEIPSKNQNSLAEDHEQTINDNVYHEVLSEEQYYEIPRTNQNSLALDQEQASYHA